MANQKYGKVMKMKPCKTCGQLIAKNAKYCPSCGQKYSRISGCFAVVVIFFAIIMMISYVVNNISNQNSTRQQTNNDILEVRVCPNEGINIRTGPGTEFTKDKSGQLVKGEKLYVLEEKNGWIRFRVTREDVGWSGWVKKNLTVLDPHRESSITDDINVLKANGLIKKITPQMNEAYLDPMIWNALDYQAKENIGRIMAFYCGQEKGTNLNWVEIKDFYTGRKIAKYSENWGFEVY